MKTGIIILAAGGSSRLGQPKQLLDFQGRSLLKRVTEEALKVPESVVTVVLGAAADRVREEVAGLPVRTVLNPEWEQGMAGSVRTGMQDLLPLEPGQCILTVCDQPYVDAGLFTRLQQTAGQTGKGIVATGFSGTWGVPVLFSRKYFQDLLLLEGPGGAKQWIKQHREDLAVVEFEPAAIDVDTLDDYHSLPRNMVGVEEAGKMIDFHVTSHGNSVELALIDGLGYVLAQDVMAPFSIPAYAQSSMDGYAIRYEDRYEILEVTGQLPAGAAEPRTLEPGKAIRIFTGAPLPSGADTVVMQEKVRVTERGMIKVEDQDVTRGDHVRLSGSEAEAGAVALRKGSLLTPAAIGYLAGLGCATVSVYAPPRVALILTGNELIPPGEPPQLGEVYESNSYQLRGAMKLLGIHECAVFQARDDLQELKTAIREALQHCDVLLLVGGVSVGDFDFVVSAAAECGVEQRFHRVRQKPGKPLFFGMHGKKPVFGLPGNPSSALTCFYLYVSPVLEKWMRRPVRNTIRKAQVSFDYPKKAGLTHFLKAWYDGLTVMPLHAQESYRLQSYAQANCLLILEETSPGCKAGEEVSIFLL